MKDFYLQNKADIDKILQFTALVIFIYIFCKYLACYFSPLIFGYVVCIILSPIVRLLHKKLHFPRPLASILSMALLIFIIIFLGTNVVSKVIDEGKSFAENSPQLISGTVETIRELEDELMSYADILPESVKENSDRLLNEALATLTGLLSTGVKVGSVEVVKFLPNTLFVTLLGLICSFFLLNDRELVERFLIRQLPEPLKNRARVAKTGVISAIGGYVRAQCILMCIVACICCVGLVILHSSYALLLAILISFVDALPVFGSGAIFWPWCIYSVIVGDYKMAMGLAIIDIVVIITRQILEPRILGKQIGLHPLATLMSIFIGLKVFGLFGFIIGPIILVTVKAMQESDLLPRWK